MNDTPNWTPGTWRAEHGYVGDSCPLFVTAPGADGIRPWNDDDAYLIAASKELYRACRVMEKFFDDLEDAGEPCVTPADFRRLIQVPLRPILDAALKKARGEK